MTEKKRTSLREAIQVLERLEVVDGRMQKESILEAHKDNLALQAILKMAIGTDRYYVRPAMNIVCNSSLTVVESWRQFRKLAAQLKHRQITGNEANRRVYSFLSSCRPLLMKWYCRIINHDLRIGVDRATVAKIWGSSFLYGDSADAIHWNHKGCAVPMDFADAFTTASIPYPLGLESQYAGCRANLICFPRDNQIHVFSETGKPREEIAGIAAFRDQVLEFCRVLNNDAHAERPLYLDGQFYAPGADATRIVRKRKLFNSEKFLTEVRLVLWDWMPLDRYLAGVFDMMWQHRKAQLLHAAGCERPTPYVVKCSSNLWVAGHSMVYSDDQLRRQYEKRLDAGHAGVVLKRPRAPHRLGASADLVKLRPEVEQTGRIVDVVVGKGQHSAVAAALRTKIQRLMERCGTVKMTEQYLYCKTDRSAELVKRIKKITQNNQDRRLYKRRKDIVAFRHGPRLGHLVVQLENGTQVQVGGGFTQKANNDERALFWRKRNELLGMQVVFRRQICRNKLAAEQLNRFVRLENPTERRK